jgi:hypothetical protein
MIVSATDLKRSGPRLPDLFRALSEQTKLSKAATPTVLSRCSSGFNFCAVGGLQWQRKPNPTAEVSADELPLGFTKELDKTNQALSI